MRRVPEVRRSRFLETARAEEGSEKSEKNNGGKSVTPEEFDKIWNKTLEQMHKEQEEYKAKVRPIREAEERKRAEEAARLRELKRQREENLPHDQRFHGWCEHPNTIENSTATFFWIVAMGVSILFKGGWILCILETVIWFKFITRHD